MNGLDCGLQHMEFDDLSNEEVHLKVFLKDFYTFLFLVTFIHFLFLVTFIHFLFLVTFIHFLFLVTYHAGNIALNFDRLLPRNSLAEKTSVDWLICTAHQLGWWIKLYWISCEPPNLPPKFCAIYTV